MKRCRGRAATPRGRILRSETLEPRFLLALDLPFQNPGGQFDVNRDLRVTALDALQVINFVGRNGSDFVLPATNSGIRYPDVNGSRTVTSLDALQIINRLSPTVGPILSARLVNDSAPGGQQNLDFLTNTYSLEFGVTHGDGTEQLELRINGSGNDPFVGAGALTGDPLAVSEAELDTIAGSTLADGDQQFEVRLAGDLDAGGFTVTVDKSAPDAPATLQMSPATDSGPDNTDGITNVDSPIFQGDAETGSLVTLLIDDTAVGQTIAGSPFQIPAGTLSEGTHAATATAEDPAGNLSELSSAFHFEIDLTLPDEPSFDLDPGSDSAPLGDSTTTIPIVTLVGQTSPDAAVVLVETGLMTAADAGGEFRFNRVGLQVGSNSFTARAIDAAGNEREFSTVITLQNTPPQLDPVGPLNVMPGDRIEVQLSANDADGDAVTFRIMSDGTLPPGTLSGNTLSFQPTPADIGSFQFTLIADDGKEPTSQQVTLNVVEDPVSGTRISGRILDTLSQPLVGVRVSIGGVEDFTTSDGSFELGFGNNALPGDTLRVHADELTGGETYPFIAEKLPLLFGGRNVIGGVNNVISRPIFLPALDMDNAVTIDPSQDMTVTTAAIPGIALRIAAGSLMDRQGGMFNGLLSITAVPPDLTPAALPEGSSPDLVVTIQPGDMVFTQPAPLDFPNTAGWAPGLMMNIMSINPVTGEFDDVGDAVVSADGTTIETISGGVRNSSWHYPEPPPPPPHFPPDEDECEDCDLDGDFPSTVNLANGSVSETHDLVTYQSVGQRRGLTLNYESLRADPRPIFHFDYDDVDPERIFSVPEALQVVARTSVIVDGVEIVSDGFENPGEFGLRGGENFFNIPLGSGPLDGAVQIDLADQPTGIYPRKMQVGLRGFTGSRFLGSSTVFAGEFVHVNSSNSPFGSGWSIEGLQEIVEGPDGSVAIIDGDGSLLRWQPGARQIQDFLASNQNDESVQRFDGITGALREDFVLPGAGGLNNPHNPTIGGDGNLYVVSDSGGAAPQVLRYDGQTGEFLDVFVNTGEGGYTGAAEQAFASDGSLYLATVSNLGVLRFDRFGNFIDSVAGPADGVQQACGIEFGSDGLLYVYDTLDEELRRFDPVTGDFVDLFIPPGSMFNACDFDFGPDGDIFITDLTLSEIRRFSGVDGSFLGTFANTNPGASGITFGPDGNFYANIGGNTQRFNGQTGEFIDEFVSGLGGFNNFLPPPPPGFDREFINPAGDFSRLEQLPDGTYQRTMPDATVFTFNDQNKLETIVDRNGNTTQYAYDVEGNLTSITDPVGLATTLTYDDGRVSTITDPASRQTLLEYDAAGNLTRITDPDGTSRSFTYDERHLMTGETDKRGNQEFEFYDDFGRATRAVLDDGSEIRVTPRHVRGLFPVDSTRDPNNAPDAARGNVDSLYIDANGNTQIAVMDANGQFIAGRDDVGPLPSISRDPDTNRVTRTTDARGNITDFTYDESGNLTSIADSLNSGRLARIGQLPIENFPATFAGIDLIRGVTLSGDQAYVFGDGGLHTVDVSDPANPAHVGVDFVNGSDFGLVDGDRLLAVSAGSAVSGFSDLRFFDLSGGGTPQDPAPRDSLEIPYVLGDQIVVNGNFVFVSHRQFRRMGANDIFEQNGTVVSIDISDPDNLVQSDVLFNANGATNEPPVVSMGGNFLVGGLALADTNTLYVGSTTATGTDTQTGTASLLVIDVSDPTQINAETDPGVIDKVLQLPGTTLISDILISGNVAYLLGSEGGLRDNSPDSGDFGPTGNLALSSIDISDPKNPLLIRTQVLDRAARGGFNDNGLNLTEIGPDLLAITSLGAVGDTPQLITIDVSDPNDFLFDQRIDLSSSPQGLAADQQFVYVTASDGLSVYELRDPVSLGTPRTFTYDPIFNQRTSATDDLGRQVLFDIDPANGNRLSTTQVIGDIGGGDDVVTQFTYTTDGLVDTITDPLGRVTDFDYDTLGRLTTTTFALGTADEASRQFEYDAAGNQTALIDENGNRTEFEYDPLNRVRRIIEPDPDGPGPLASPITQFTYDAAGNVTSETDAGNNITTFQYDSRDRIVRQVDAQNNITQFEYDGLGNLVSQTDPNGNETRFIYDARSRIVQQIDPAGGTTSLQYDLDDNLTTVTDAETNRTTFSYDPRDRIIRETDPIGNVSTFTYDAANNLVSQIDRNGRETQFVYDDLNRLVTETWVGDGNVLSYSYDAVGNLASATDNFSALAFTYDNRDRLKTTDNSGTPGAPSVPMVYVEDAVGNVTSVSGVSVGTTQYVYDANNRLISLTQSGDGVSEKRVDFAYEPDGQFAEITRFSDLGGTQTVVTSTYVYDALNRLTSLSHDNDSSTVALFNYRYDAGGRITQTTDVDGVSTYAYDGRDQLTSADHSSAGNPDESYVYDAGGNRTNSHLHGTGYQTGDNNRLESDGTFDYSYDDEGNLIRRTEIASEDFRQFVWDHRNRLTGVIDRDAADNEIQRVDFTYDALDRRISKEVTDAADTVLTHYIYDRDNVLLDFVDDDGATGPNAAVLAQRYLHGPAVDQILAQDDGGGNVLWHLANHLGTVTDLVDSSGEVVNHVTYDSFGNVIDQSDPAMTTRYLYTGREFDQELQLYYYRARYYDPSIGRFLSQDPLGFAAGDLNLYRYVGNDVVNMRDPTGLCEVPDDEQGDGNDDDDDDETLRELIRQLERIRRTIEDVRNTVGEARQAVQDVVRLIRRLSG